MRRWAGKALDFAPGTKWQYSNTNYVIAAAIVERVSGMPFERYIRTELFEPLGMSRSTADPRALADSVTNFVFARGGGDAGALYERLLREGVIVRPVANYGMPNHLRVTVGLPAENSRFLEALSKVLARG